MSTHPCASKSHVSAEYDYMSAANIFTDLCFKKVYWRYVRSYCTSVLLSTAVWQLEAFSTIVCI
jgi:hypothetical protein